MLLKGIYRLPTDNQSKYKFVKPFLRLQRNHRILPQAERMLVLGRLERAPLRRMHPVSGMRQRALRQTVGVHLQQRIFRKALRQKLV
jgi:hypothetical protein